MGKQRLLLVESDPDLREALGEQLDRVDDFQTQRLDRATAALALMEDGRPHPGLILLDAHLPDLDGAAASAALRALGVRCPIILLAARDDDDETIRGLNAGANDHLVKPLRFGVLVARIRAQLRSFADDDQRVVRVGRFRFHAMDRLLVDDAGEGLRLTDKECAILKFLLRANGEAVTRDVLLQEIWGYGAAVSTHTLETHIYRLRRKIEIDPTAARLLVTDGGGYKLMT